LVYIADEAVPLEKVLIHIFVDNVLKLGQIR
jgi:hypothetical protein